ncbi:hypothetical protein OG393_16555 [Streptomyces sp. NBC_01216]|uniref:hypothetical protein n=1 Tax=Streptomyces sp. NBC_01216 TaxID=2903778 RepID=UPI002E0D4CB1|nr:hypothetical protein OG393_16555 [Streptomyces sp. NBC_01216]
MTTAGIDLDAIPPDTLVVQDGRITPIGELLIAKVAEDLAAVCQQADDPLAAVEALREIVPAALRAIADQRASVEPSPLRKFLSNCVGSECLERRPGHDPLTGDRLDGQSDTDDTFPDRLPCTRQHGHSGDHRDVSQRSWRRTEMSS